MNLDQLLGLTRALMTALGGMLVGHYFITASVWEGLTGAALAAGGLGWGVYQKSLMLDQVASAVRAMMGGLGGYAVQRGWITSDQLTAWIGVGLATVPVVWTYVYHATPAAPAVPVAPPVARIDSHWIVGLAIIGLMLVLGGCKMDLSAGLSAAIVDIKAVAAKIDAGLAVAQDELPVACSLARTSGSIVATAINLGLTKSLPPPTQATIAKAQIGISAAGVSDMCVAAAKGLAPATPQEASAQLLSAFVQVRAAVRGTAIDASASAAADKAGG